MGANNCTSLLPFSARASQRLNSSPSPIPKKYTHEKERKNHIIGVFFIFRRVRGEKAHTRHAKFKLDRFCSSWLLNPNQTWAAVAASFATRSYVHSTAAQPESLLELRRKKIRVVYKTPLAPSSSFRSRTAPAPMDDHHTMRCGVYAAVWCCLVSALYTFFYFSFSSCAQLLFCDAISHRK